jgi:hypothetical protein
MSAQIRIISQDKVHEAANPKVASTSLQFVAEEVDFGTIEEMSGVWQGSAKLVNRGKESIALTQIKTTCGCLKVEVPKRVLAPKEELAVTLKYYPRGHAGRVLQRVLIYTNGSSDAPSAILRLRGMVTASADRSDDYPYTRGALRLRQEALQIDGMQPQTLRVACMNGGSVVLRPMADAMLTSKGLKVRFEPAELAPKQEGDMVIEYLPVESAKKSEILKIYINGLNLSPRHCVVEIKLKE